MLSLFSQARVVARQTGCEVAQRRSACCRAPSASLSGSQAGVSPVGGVSFQARRRRVHAAAEKKEGAAAPSQEAPKAAPAEAAEDLPPWVRSERERELAAQSKQDLPFAFFLLSSAIVAIAAVGSIYEYSAGNPIFGVLPKENPLWAPILLFFAVTGFPMSGYLFYRSVKAANEESERADKIDGYY